MSNTEVSHLSEETKIPLKWVIALLIGASGFVGSAVAIGMYFGSRDANAAGLANRVAKLENEVAVFYLVDRRLARIEGALNIRVPEADRLPASKE